MMYRGFFYFFYPSTKSKRGQNSSRFGREGETELAECLKTLTWNGHPFHVKETAGTKSTPDVPTEVNGRIVNFENKRLKAFEGGCGTFDLIDGKLQVKSDGIIKTLVGSYIPFQGRIPPFLIQSLTRWDNTEFKDERLDVRDTAVAEYYHSKGVSYICIAGDIYHTGEDVLEFGVPLFKCKTQIRIRTTKHKRKNGVPRDVYADLNYDRKTLQPSPYNIFSRLPPSIQVAV